MSQTRFLPSRAGQLWPRRCEWVPGTVEREPGAKSESGKGTLLRRGDLKVPCRVIVEEFRKAGEAQGNGPGGS